MSIWTTLCKVNFTNKLIGLTVKGKVLWSYMKVSQTAPCKSEKLNIQRGARFSWTVTANTGISKIAPT